LLCVTTLGLRTHSIGGHGYIAGVETYGGHSMGVIARAVRCSKFFTLMPPWTDALAKHTYAKKVGKRNTNERLCVVRVLLLARPDLPDVELKLLALKDVTVRPTRLAWSA